MSAGSPVVRAAEEKAKKQKKLLGILSVVLLGLLGFQLPKLLGGDATSTEATPAPEVAAQSILVTPGTLPDTDRVQIRAESGKLVSFGLFKSKDPFVQQLSEGGTPPLAAPIAAPSLNPQGASPLTGAAGSPTRVITPPQLSPSTGHSTITGNVTPVTTAKPQTLPASTVPKPSTTPITPVSPITPTPVTPITPTPAKSGTTTSRTTTTTPTAGAASVAIATNGVCETLNKNGTFPGSEDIFRVISIARDGKSAKISVVGGAYESGAPSVTIKLGERVTLVNTADGARYVIVMKARCDVETEASPSPPAATTTAQSTTVGPPPTTTSVTTPIVTDALDTTTPTP